MISLKVKGEIIFFSGLLLCLFFVMSFSLNAGEMTAKQISKTVVVNINTGLALDKDKKMNSSPAQTENWASVAKKKNLKVFFLIGAIINIIIMAWFFRWAYKEWKK